MNNYYQINGLKRFRTLTQISSVLLLIVSNVIDSKFIENPKCYTLIMVFIHLVLLYDFNGIIEVCNRNKIGQKIINYLLRQRMFHLSKM